MYKMNPVIVHKRVTVTKHLKWSLCVIDKIVIKRWKLFRGIWKSPEQREKETDWTERRENSKKTRGEPEIATELGIDSRRGREMERDRDRITRETVDAKREEREGYGGQKGRTNGEEK